MLNSRQHCDIALVVSDVDGTLVTRDKRLTPASVAAVRELEARGVGFTVTSSRPPIGLRMLVEPLGLKLPMGAFNGAMMVDPHLNVLEHHVVPEPAVRRALEVLAQFKIEAWLYTADQWLIRNPSAPHVEHEIRTIQADPVVVSDFSPYVGKVGKIVGVDDDYDRLDRCETEMREALGSSASTIRSQRYYLDITAPNVNKGTFVAALAHRLGVPKDAIATLGDMPNDIPSFENSGLSIAMGNAEDSVKEAADFVTDTNDAEGFATALRRWILPAAQPCRLPPSSRAAARE